MAGKGHRLGPNKSPISHNPCCPLFGVHVHLPSAQTTRRLSRSHSATSGAQVDRCLRERRQHRHIHCETLGTNTAGGQGYRASMQNYGKYSKKNIQ